MACPLFERRILEYLEHQLPEVDSTLVQAHLLRCKDCRAFAEQLRQLDVALAKAPIPTLSTDFVERLTERIRADRAFVSEPDRAERKRQIQADFEKTMAKLHRDWLGFGTLLQGIAGAIALVITVLLVSELAPALAAHPVPPSVRSAWLLLIPSLIAAAVFLSVGLTAAFPRRFRLLLE